MTKQCKNVIQEKRIMHELNHPFLLKLIATVRDQHCLYLITEFLQGPSESPVVFVYAFVIVFVYSPLESVQKRKLKNFTDYWYTIPYMGPEKHVRCGSGIDLLQLQLRPAAMWSFVAQVATFLQNSAIVTAYLALRRRGTTSRASWRRSTTYTT